MEENIKFIDYIVTDGPIAVPGGEVFQNGNTVSFPEGTAFADQAVQVGMIVIKPIENLPTAANTLSVPITHIQKQYRGRDIVSESNRTVSGRTFKHVRLSDGSECDLTEQEYQTEVSSA